MTPADACELAASTRVADWPMALIEARWGFGSIFGEVRWIPMGAPLVDVLAASGLSPSKRRAREDIGAGAVMLNGRRVTDSSHVIRIPDLRDGETVDTYWLVVSRGKHSHRILEVRWPWVQ